MKWGHEELFDRVIGGHEYDFHGGIDIGPSGDFGRIEERDGKRCLLGDYFLFDVADDYAFDIDEELEIEILFDRDITTDGFIFTYDAVGEPVTFKHVFAEQNNNRWHWEKLRLKRARFANRRNVASDFGIASLAAKVLSNEGNENVAICDIRIQRFKKTTATPEKGSLYIKIQDERGQPLAARVGLYDITGKQPLPDDGAVVMSLIGMDTNTINLVKPQETTSWPGKGKYIFYAEDSYRVRLPTGKYQLVLYKGPEYYIYQKEFNIQLDQLTHINATLKRWTDMPAKSWYSGDTHVHATRRSVEDNHWLMSLMKAEEVNLVGVLQSGSHKNPNYFPSYAFGKRGQYQVADYVITPGQENPNTGELGHTIGLNTRAYHQSPDYFIYKDVAEAVHNDGGVFGYSHLSIYPITNMQRGMALDVPFGLVDFVEILQYDGFGPALKLYYDFLNMGFKLLPSAGTDFPFSSALGTERQYVKISGSLSAEAWFEHFKLGHTFVTTAPILDLTVNEVGMGDELHIKHGDTVRVRARASVNPDLDRLTSLELIAHGEVVARVTAKSGVETLDLAHTLQPQEGLWLAVRTYGQMGSEAHSAPVYIYVDGERSFIKKSVLRELIHFYQAELYKIGSWVPDYYEHEGRLDFSEEFLHQEWKRQLPQLMKRVYLAVDYYEKLLDDSFP